MNIAAGIAYLALVEGPSKLLLDDPAKLEPHDAYAAATRLKDFHDRFAQLARKWSVRVVAVAHTRRHAQWVYASAFDRASLEAAIMLAAESEQIKYVSVKQTKPTAKAARIAHPDEAADELASLYAVDGVKHWKERSIALMVALAVAKGGAS